MKASQQPDGSIRVVWSAVDGAVRYSLTRSVPPAGATLMTLPKSPDTVYVDRDVKSGSTYYYLVAAVNEAGVTGLKVSAPPVTATAPIASDTTTRSTDTTSAPALAAPTNVVAQPLPYMEPTVTWQSSLTRVRFLVERRAPNSSDPSWKKIEDNTVATGHWKCCVAHDRNTLESLNLEYRVTAVDTVTPSSKSPPVVSNTIVNWAIKTDPPVLNDITMRVGESKRFPWPSNRTADFENPQWVSLTPSVASVDPDNGLVTALYQGRTYIVASGVVRRHVDYVGTWIWRVDVQ
jgi:hypothetical protein